MLVVRAVTQRRNGLSGILLSAHGWLVAEASHFATQAAGSWLLSRAAQQSAIFSGQESSNVGDPQIKNMKQTAPLLSQQGLSTSSCSQADQVRTNLTTFAAAQVDSVEYEVQRQLMDLGLPRSVAEQAMHQASKARQPYQQLPAHMQTLLKVAGPNTAHQRKTFLRSVPTLLQSTPEALTDAAVQLTEFLAQLGVPGQAVQQFVRQQPLVLQESPQSTAAQLADWAKLLGTEPAEVLSRVWCADSENPLYRQPFRRMQLRVNATKNSFQLNNKNMVQMLESWPDMLLFGPGELRERLSAIWDCLKPYGWTRERLTPALPEHPHMLARDVKQIQGVRDMVQAYAAVHPPSQRHLQDVAGTPAILAVFQCPELNMLLIQYITNGMQQKLQPQADVWRAPAVASSGGDTTDSSGDLSSDSSRNTGGKGVSRESRRPRGVARHAKESRPTVWQLINLGPKELELLVDRKYPSFWRWEKHQQQVRQHAERLQQLENERNQQRIKWRLRKAEQWSRRGTWRKA